jgi:hypothetical protein
MRSTVLVAALGLAFAGAVAAPVPVDAADGKGLVSTLEVTPGSVVADGLTGGQEVRVRATVSAIGIGSNTGEGWYYGGILATVERTAGGPHDSASFELQFAPYGYDGSWRVGSTRVGTWTVTKLTWYAVGSGFASVDPRVEPGVTRTFTVVGTHVPTIGSVRIPRVVAYGSRQWVQYTVHTSAGAPAVGLPVRSATNNSCVLPQVPPGESYLQLPQASWTPVLRTDANGRVTIPLYTSSTARCVDIWSQPSLATSPETAADLASLSPTRYEYYKWVSAVPTAPAVRVNRTLTVIGSAFPNKGVVQLQRLLGRTWRPLASATIRTSGRYTVYGLVPTLGRNYYRVVALNGDRTLAPTPSRVVLVIGTRR